MKTTSTLLLTTFLATTFSTAGPIAKAVVLDNNGNLTNSVAKKAAKVAVADEMIDSDDGAAEKVVKAKVVRGDYRAKRKIENRR